MSARHDWKTRAAKTTYEPSRSNEIAGLLKPIVTVEVGPVDRYVVAGGGGTSTGGTFRLEGTVGEVGAANITSGGPFILNGGFWNTLSAVVSPTATPSVTPTPTPTATPTPTPTSGPMIYVEQGTDQLAAVDSVTLVRGPFTLLDTHNFSGDQRTRIMFCTTNLGLTQPSHPDSSTLEVQVGGFTLTAESAGPMPGMDASYIVIRLPDLGPGNWPLSIRFLGVNSLNSPIVSIVAPP